MGAYDGKGKGFCNYLRCCTGQIKCSLGARISRPAGKRVTFFRQTREGRLGGQVADDSSIVDGKRVE